MITQEFSINGEVKKTEKVEAASIAFPPFERSEAAGRKLHEIMHTAPFPSMDEVFKTPELMAKVEQAAREAEIGGAAPRKSWVTQVSCNDTKGRPVSAIPPEDEEAAATEEPLDEEQPQGDAIPPDIMRAYLVTRARIVTNGAEWIENLSDGELADLCAMSPKRFISIQEWIDKRYPR